MIAPLPSVALRFLSRRSSFFGLLGPGTSGLAVSTSDESCLRVCVRFLLASAKALGSSFGLLAGGSSRSEPEALAVGGGVGGSCVDVEAGIVEEVEVVDAEVEVYRPPGDKRGTLTFLGGAVVVGAEVEDEGEGGPECGGVG